MQPVKSGVLTLHRLRCVVRCRLFLVGFFSNAAELRFLPSQDDGFDVLRVRLGT